MMPLLFSRVCDLLSVLEDLVERDPPLLRTRLQQRINDTIKSWFVSHRVSVHSTEIDPIALLSTLFPTKRSDRVYYIQPARLSRSLRRWLSLGKGRWPLLDQWQEPKRGDLGNCVERVLQQAENPVPNNKDKVTLEEIDKALASVAAQCRFSAPKVRARGIEDDVQVSNTIENIYKKLQSREAKWFTRLILKDFSRLNLPESLVHSCIDSRLSVALQTYNDFESAVCELRKVPVPRPDDICPGDADNNRASKTHMLLPRIGVKVGPSKWIKAKGGIKHAVSIIDGRTMGVERKHDGEYCQIHIDLSKDEECIQIFSKSGKDSSEDRAGVHDAIRDSLRIGSGDCPFAKHCILEGELLVYSDRSKEILAFHKIRKHVSRSGSFLGTAKDSQPHHWEHLMIVFYDVLLIDDKPVLHEPYKQRRKQLEKMVKCIDGRSDRIQQRYIDFSKPGGTEKLKEGFASALVERWEGLVLKPADESYFDLGKSTAKKPFSRWIKLKKDCVKGLGDTADFSVIGAGYDNARASKFNIPHLRWTHFFIGCLRNKSHVLVNGAKPSWYVFDEISDCINKEDLKTLNELGHIRSMDPSGAEARDHYNIDFAPSLSPVKVIFRTPFVFDIAGSGFDKSPNRDIYTLRFPRVMKIHWDRDWKETVSLQELQELAVQATKVPPKDIWWDELDVWKQKLDQIDLTPKGRQHGWSDLEDEDEHFDNSLFQGSPTSILARSRRPPSHSTAAAPLVRMDTKEMTERERRLSTGEVVDKQESKQSTASAASRTSLETPPPSSPLSETGHADCVRLPRSTNSGCTQEKKLKRPSVMDELGQSPRRSKRKLQPEALQTAMAERNQTTNACSTASYKEPLREVKNMANPHPRSPSKLVRASDSIKRPAAETLSIVRKLPPGAEEDIYQRHKRRKIIIESPSSGRQTTASERSSTTTSQSQSQSQPTPTAREHVSALVQAAKMAAHDSQSLPTPPSTAEQSLQVNLPSLTECKIVLSPCLIQNHEPIEPLKEALDALLVDFSSFSMAFRSPRSNNILHSTEEPTVQILLLIGQNGQEAADDMTMLVKHVPIWHPLTLAVWNWEILELIRERDPLAVNDGNDLVIHDNFFALMAWDPEWEGRGAVKVLWRDGRVDMVPEEGFPNMGE